MPVGFKYIPSKIDEVDAVLGGESSGGLTVKGHIRGKDGIYASALLVEMIAKTGKSMSQILQEIEDKFGKVFLEERDYTFTQARKEEIKDILLNQKQLPELPLETERVSYMDGCKVYFANGGWISVRFSGTEPLLRIFCEMPDPQTAADTCRVFEEFLQL